MTDVVPSGSGRRSRSIGGRVAIVTGAASGMGRAIADLFVSEGAHVALVDRDEPALLATVDELNKATSNTDHLNAATVNAATVNAATVNAATVNDATVNDATVNYGVAGAPPVTGAPPVGRAVAYVADVSDAAAIVDVVESVRRDLGPIDILVNNAGVPTGSTLDQPDYEAVWQRTFAVNLDAPMRFVRACLDDLVRNGDGRIVNIASTEALTATPRTSPYTASKTGLVGFTRSLAVDLGRRGVTANCICPGPINTQMTQRIPAEAKATFARRRVPVGRYGDPEEVAHVVLSLVLPASSYITGAVIPVDGGMSASSR